LTVGVRADVQLDVLSEMRAVSVSNSQFETDPHPSPLPDKERGRTIIGVKLRNGFSLA